MVSNGFTPALTITNVGETPYALSLNKNGTKTLTFNDNGAAPYIVSAVTASDKWSFDQSTNVLKAGTTEDNYEITFTEAWQKILCRRFSTKVKNGAVK